MTMKLWSLAEISEELSANPEFTSAVDSNLINLNNKALCHLPYFFPFTNQAGELFNILGTHEGLAAIALAAQHLNTGDGSIVPEVAALANNACGIKFNIGTFDVERSESVAVDQIIKITDRTKTGVISDGAGIENDNNLLLSPPCVILGASRSAVSMPTSIISGLRGFPQISPISTSPDLDDKSQYKYFARTIPNDDGTSIPLIARLNSGSDDETDDSWGVNFLAVIYIDDAYGSAFAQGIVLAAQEMAPNMQVKTFSISTNPTDEQIERKIASMAESQFMYFFGILTPTWLVDKVMTAAFNAGIAGTGKHTWLFSDSVGSGPVGRDFPLGSPLERAYRGTGLLSARGGIEGMEKYDSLGEQIRGLADSVEDREYLKSLLPKYNSNGQLVDYSEITDSDSYLATTGLVGPFLYDAVITAGLSACSLKMNYTTSSASDDFVLSGEEHYKAIVNTTFDGTSGPVVFNSKTGTRTPRSALFILENFVVDPDTSTSTIARFITKNTDVFQSGEWRSLQPFVFNNGDTIAPSDLPETEVDQNYIPVGLRAVGLTLCCIIIALSIGFSVWTKKKENHRVVKAAQPIFLHIIAIGTLLMGCAIIPLSLDPGSVTMEGADNACISMPWLLACGFSMTFSALFTKTHRILTIMRNAAAFKRATVTPLDVAKPMIFLLLVNVITLTVWTAVDPLRSETIVLEENDLGQPTETENICNSKHRSIFYAVLGVINFGALLVAFVEAYLARKISVELSESSYIMKAISIILLISCMGIPVIIIASDNRSAFYFVAVAIIFVICTSVLGLIFVPKIRASMKKKQRRSSTFTTLNSLRGFSSQSEADEEGIKILSTPKKIKELEAENHKLRQMMNSGPSSRSSSISGRRFSKPLADLADASRRFSQASSNSSRRVKFNGSIPHMDDIEDPDAIIANGGVENGIKEESNSKSDNSIIVDLGNESGTVTNTTEEEKQMEEIHADEAGNVVDDVEGGAEEGNATNFSDSEKRIEEAHADGEAESEEEGNEVGDVVGSVTSTVKEERRIEEVCAEEDNEVNVVGVEDSIA